MNRTLKLSICIPSYNSGKILLDNIQRMLEVESDEFEIVVNDNCSTTGVYKELYKINDDRLKIFQNNENIGYFKNCYIALTKGEGRYVHLVMDRDYLKPEYLKQYIDDVYNSNADVFQTSYGDGDSLGKNPYYYIFRFSHPSCFCFLKEKLVNLEEINTDLETAYPWALWAVNILSSDCNYKFYSKTMVKTVEESYYSINYSSSERWKRTVVKADRSYESYQAIMYCRILNNFLKYSDTNSKYFQSMLICLFSISSKYCLLYHYGRYREKSYMIKRYNLRRKPFSLGQYISIQIWFNNWCQKRLKKNKKLTLKTRMYMNYLSLEYVIMMIMYYFWLDNTALYKKISNNIEKTLLIVHPDR